MRTRSLRRGFTLIEIIIVVIIVAVMFAVTLPTLRSTRDNNRLRADVRELMSLMKYARAEAVFNARTTEVFIDTDRNLFWLDLRTPDPKTGRYNPKAPKTQMERKRELEQQVGFEALNVLEDNILKDGVIAFDFYPDGTASPGFISLTNSRGAIYTIEVFKSTGMVELNEGDLETVADARGSVSYPLPDGYYEGYEPSEAVQ